MVKYDQQQYTERNKDVCYMFIWRIRENYSRIIVKYSSLTTRFYKLSLLHLRVFIGFGGEEDLTDYLIILLTADNSIIMVSKRLLLVYKCAGAQHCLKDCMSEQQNSDQHAHPLRLARLFAVRLITFSILSYQHIAIRRPWSNWSESSLDARAILMEILITKTRLFKYTENFTTKKMKIFR